MSYIPGHQYRRYDKNREQWKRFFKTTPPCLRPSLSAWVAAGKPARMPAKKPVVARRRRHDIGSY